MDAVAAVTASLTRFQPLNGVTDPKYPYSVYSATLGRGDTYLMDSREGVRWGRVVVQSFGKTAESALTAAEAARDELVGTSLPIAGYRATPIRSELDPTVVRDPDDTGVVGVTATYTFTATKEAR